MTTSVAMSTTHSTDERTTTTTTTTNRPPPLSYSSTYSSSGDSAAVPPTAISSATQQLKDNDDVREEHDQAAAAASAHFTNTCRLGSLSTDSCRYAKVVGIRYYRGVAHPGEYVTLVREPHNPYDRNAVRVDNLRGEKVGHIKRELAVSLSRILDHNINANANNNNSILTIDASIPRTGNVYELPLELHFYGPPDLESLVQTTFRSIGGYRSSGGAAAPSPGASKTASSSSSSSVVVQSRTVDWKHENQQQLLDDMFAKQVEEQLQNLPQVPLPSPPLTSVLLDHQKLGMRWMVQQEEARNKSPVSASNSSSSNNNNNNSEQEQQQAQVPFYRTVREQGKTVWLCEITQASQPHKPAPVRGGILADDMGLGKTLQTIALILANPPEGRDYTQPQLDGASVPSSSAPSLTSSSSSSASAGTTTTTTLNYDDINQYQHNNNDKKKPTKTAVQKLKVAPLHAVLKAANLAIPMGGKTKPDLVKAVMAALENGSLSAELYHTTTTLLQQRQQHSSSDISGTSSRCRVGGGPITTLIVCPVSVMSNWQSQIDQHVAPHTFRVALYHGTDRKELLRRLDQIDVLIASYGSLQADFISNIQQQQDVKLGEKSGNTTTTPDQQAAKRFKATHRGGQHDDSSSSSSSSSIFHTQFHRVVLDEAHTVRNPKSRTFQACHSLQATHRWCLTGTPLQNKPEDIQSLWQFLRVPPLGDAQIFRRAISQPIKEGQEEGLARLRAMMAHVALRRNKSMVSASGSIELVPKDIQIRSVVAPPDSQHQQIYDTLFRSAKMAFAAALQNSGGSGDENNHRHHAMEQQQNQTTTTTTMASAAASIFEVLTRLRQACCSGSLVPPERLQRAKEVLRTIDAAPPNTVLSAEEGLRLLEKLKGALLGGTTTAAPRPAAGANKCDDNDDDDGPPDCAVCLEPLAETTAVVLRACGHVFCQECIGQVAQTSGVCPFCRHSFGKEDMIAWSVASQAAAATAAAGAETTDQQEHTLPADTSSKPTQLGPSPKMEALLAALREMQPGEKAVCFSQFTKFLDEIEPFLTTHGYTFTRIDGKKTAAQRIKALTAFGSGGQGDEGEGAADGGPTIMLCSLHAAGTGINLTRANHVFMMDTWFNLSVEQQAMDRVHRIGQTRPVRILRFVTADSVESRMLALQEAKAALGKGAFENLSAEEKKKARLGDVKKLLDLCDDGDDDDDGDGDGGHHNGGGSGEENE